jgi:cobalt-zinc-cadmium efflux system outer membrane protein
MALLTPRRSLDSMLIRHCVSVFSRSATTGALLSLAAAGHQAGAQGSQSRGGLTLADVVRTAVERSPLIGAARARAAATRGSRVTAGTFSNPTLTYQVENAGFPGRTAPVGLVAETSSFITLPLEQLWLRWSRVQRADEDVLAAEAEVSVARRQVAGDAARIFFRVAAAQVSVTAASDIQAGLDSLVRYTDARVTAGAAAEGDLIRLQVERDRAAIDRLLQQVELARARAALAPFLADAARSSDPLGLVVVVEDSLFGGRSVLAPESAFVAHAVVVRPDVLAARARARAARAEVTLQRLLVVRQFGATFGTKSTAGVSSMIAGLSLPFPIFDQNRGEMQRAAGERLASERALTWVERAAAADVGAAYESARILTAYRAPFDGQFLGRAAEARRIAVAAYQEGAVPLLQVLDATRALADARGAYYRALFARQSSLLELYAAAGMELVDAFTMATPAATGASSVSLEPNRKN